VRIQEEVRRCMECRFFSPCDIESSGFGPCFDTCALTSEILVDTPDTSVHESCPLKKGKVIITIRYIESEGPRESLLRKGVGVRSWK
jgi:hypothetical protein